MSMDVQFFYYITGKLQKYYNCIKNKKTIDKSKRIVYIKNKYIINNVQ